MLYLMYLFFFFKQKTAYEMRISDWSSDVCSSDLVGSPPDRRAQAVALRHGIDISCYRGRQVTAGDFRRFDHVFALDPENLRNLRRMRPSDGTEIGRAACRERVW